jgi:hypothetical protein
LPNDIALTQYYHIRLEDANALLRHWTQRQAAGEIPFRFKKVDKADRQGKGAEGEDDASTGVGPRDQENVQEDQEPAGETQGDGGGSAGDVPDKQRQGDTSGGPSGVSELLTHSDGRCSPHVAILKPPQSHPRRGPSRQRSGQVSKASEELPTQGALALRLPNPPRPPPRHHPLAGNSTPADRQEHASNDQVSN